MLLHSTYEKVFDKYYPKLRYHSYKIIRCDDVVDENENTKDIVVDAFIELHKKWPYIINEKHAVNYLYLCVRHKSLNYLRHQKKYGTKELSDNFNELPENIVIEVDLLGMIHTNMAKLPPERKKVFVLIFIKGYSLAQVSAELNISINTVKSQRKKGIDTIRKYCYLK